jgi:glucose-1-phosphate thymidylyltransferase
MIYYPIQTLVDALITEIMIVTGGNHAGEFLRLLGNGAEFGLRHLNYTYQRGEGGIAEALGLCEHFADGDRIAVVLGDNLIEKSIRPYVERFGRQAAGAKILLKEVEDPWRFGVAELDGDRVVSIEEKPARPKSQLVVTGIYMYDAKVFEIIKTLRPSDRGEMEITDVNNAYIRMGQLSYDVLEGWWTDAGLPETLYRATTLVRERELAREQSAVGSTDQV